jgi:hypothetical protein
MPRHRLVVREIRRSLSRHLDYRQHPGLGLRTVRTAISIGPVGRIFRHQGAHAYAVDAATASCYGKPGGGVSRRQGHRRAQDAAEMSIIHWNQIIQTLAAINPDPIYKVLQPGLTLVRIAQGSGENRKRG